jgi:hypothetical protein
VVWLDLRTPPALQFRPEAWVSSFLASSSADIRVNDNLPMLKKPLRDVVAVLVALTPLVQLQR